jgi:hypothetical protein
MAFTVFSILYTGPLVFLAALQCIPIYAIWDLEAQKTAKCIDWIAVLRATVVFEGTHCQGTKEAFLLPRRPEQFRYCCEPGHLLLPASPIFDHSTDFVALSSHRGSAYIRAAGSRGSQVEVETFEKDTAAHVLRPGHVVSPILISCFH